MQTSVLSAQMMRFRRPVASTTRTNSAPVVDQNERRVLRGDEMVCERVTGRFAGHCEIGSLFSGGGRFPAADVASFTQGQVSSHHLIRMIPASARTDEARQAPERARRSLVPATLSPDHALAIERAYGQIAEGAIQSSRSSSLRDVMHGQPGRSRASTRRHDSPSPCPRGPPVPCDPVRAGASPVEV